MSVIIRESSPTDSEAMTSMASTIVIVILGLLLVIFIFVTLTSANFFGLRNTSPAPTPLTTQPSGSLITPQPIVPAVPAPQTPGNPAAPNPY